MPDERRKPGRPTAVDSAETRERIITAALEVFREVGYRGTTYREVAARAHLSRPAINHHFPAKRDLYRAAVASVHERLVAVGLAEAHSEPTLTGRVRVFLRAQGRDPEAAAFLVTSVLEAQRNPELAGDGDGALDATRTFVRWVLGDAAAAGQLTAEPDDAHLVEMLVALLCGLSFYAGFGDGEEQLDAIVDRFLALLRGDGIVRQP